MIRLIDEDWSKVDPVALAAAGYRGLIGYVSEDVSGKNLARGQVNAAHTAGLDVGLVYEYATQAALGGAPRGTRDAGIAVSHAQQLDAPGGVCLYAAVDWNVTAAQMPAVLAYALADQAAKAAAGYRAGIYASYAVCRYLAQHGYTGLLWQTYAWSDGQWWPGAVLRQTQNGIHLAGATVDQDEAEAPDWGQWPATGGIMDPLAQVVPGTGTPDHKTDRSEGEVEHDLEQFRLIMWGQIPTSVAPAGSPLAKLLAFLDNPTTGFLQMTDADRESVLDGLAERLSPKLDLLIAAVKAAGQAVAGS